MRTRRTILAGVTLILFLANACFAVTLSPGEGVALNGSVAPGGNIVAESTYTFTGAGLPTLTTTVIRDNGTGNLDFIYALAPTTQLSGPDNSIQITLSGYAGFATDVDYLNGNGNPQFAPSASRSADGGRIDYFQFLDVGPLPIVIKTNSQKFALNAAYTFQLNPEGNPLGGTNPLLTSESTEVYGPASIASAPVPELNTGTALILGGALWALWRRRKPIPSS